MIEERIAQVAQSASRGAAKRVHALIVQDCAAARLPAPCVDVIRLRLRARAGDAARRPTQVMGVRALKPEVERLIEAVLKELDLRPYERQGAKAYSAIRERCIAQGLPVPSISPVRARIRRYLDAQVEKPGDREAEDTAPSAMHSLIAARREIARLSDALCVAHQEIDRIKSEKEEIQRALIELNGSPAGTARPSGRFSITS
ncbi:hypothetical protein VI03_30980 [Burkholderia vietnamiensis]|nr:hypothetical protein VI03_30980 [Burkholderia vietnamiensis]